MKRPKNLKKGDMFRVIERFIDLDFGEIITLKKDDNTDLPCFWNADKSDWNCIYFSHLEPYAKTIRDAQVGDIVVGKSGYEHLVLERWQNTVVLSYADNFKKVRYVCTFDELEAHYTLKAEPVEQTILTMDQNAEKFGIDISNLKIAKE